MRQFIGRFGLFPWSKEDGMGHIHPDDRQAVIDLAPTGLVFECVSESRPYVVLRYGNQQIRVKPELFRPVENPKKRIGQEVVLKKDGALGTIVDIMWHYKENAHMYFLEINGKKKSKRYWAEDFE